MFRDRDHAAEMMVNYLEAKNPDFDRVIVNSFTGLPVAEKVADKLNLGISPLFCTELSKGLNGPTYGAVCQDGTLWLNDAMVREFMISPEYISDQAECTRKEIVEKARQAGYEGMPQVKGENILVLNDGVSSGMRSAAAAGSCIKNGSSQLTLAAPFISSTAYGMLENLFDRIYCLETPSFVVSVDDGYWASDLKKF
ncbi:hypothetical protein [Candidatus Nanohalovita haloferacivicina]|uniref:hypothetical protein n=1 Tax=Candidatus Nanohalovita haloferacivicina TaxID=2978046 RepID=UPI00325FC9C2